MRMKPKIKIFYEVYDNRALLEPINALPMLDQDTNREHAKRSAREWCGCVIRVKRRFSTTDPPAGTILETSVEFFKRPAPPDDSDFDKVTVRNINGAINRTFGRVTNRYLRRRKKF